jgi:uncharacterized protein
MSDAPWSKVPSDISKRIEVFVANYLREDYLAYPGPSKVRAPKIIHCSPWGTHRYQGWEIDLLDTPLLQRLRQIHQTAGCLLTFPSSTHSRFEHTLGVVHQSTKLFDSVKQRAEEVAADGGESAGGLGLNESALRNIRCAALMHDCGHGPFSHTSEEVFSLCEDMQSLTSRVDGAFPKKRPHEILAALIVMSGPFEAYLESLNKKYRAEISRDWLANTIIGTAVKPTEEYLKQIVNGPFDADKLDYIFRDSEYVGIPLAVDLDRLWYGAQISDRSADVDGTIRLQRILALDHGAAAPLEQIIFCKLMLFQTLYHHHKVRAVDCMVKGVVEYIRRENLKIDIGDAKSLSFRHATDFLWLTDETFFALPYLIPDTFLHGLIHRIRYRRLFKRALVVAKETIKEETLPNLKDIRDLARRDDAERQKECRDIALEIHRVAKVGCSPSEVWFDVPCPPSGKEAEFAPVRYPKEGHPRQYELKPLSESFPARMWADMYWQNKWRAHVFCPTEVAEAISKAAKEVIEARFGVKFNHLCHSLCHIG